MRSAQAANPLPPPPCSGAFSPLRTFSPLIFWEVFGELCHFSMAEVTNYRKRRGLRQRKFISSQFCASRARHSCTGRGPGCQGPCLFLPGLRGRVCLLGSSGFCRPSALLGSRPLPPSSKPAASAAAATQGHRPPVRRELSSASPGPPPPRLRPPWDSLGPQGGSGTIYPSQALQPNHIFKVPFARPGHFGGFQR